MSVEIPAGAGQAPGYRQIAESEAWSAPGIQVLLAGIGIARATQQVVNTGSRYQ